MNVKFAFEIYLSLCSVDVDIIENAIFVVSEVKKADNIRDNNFNKFKCSFTIFGRQN